MLLRGLPGPEMFGMFLVVTLCFFKACSFHKHDPNKER